MFDFDASKMLVVGAIALIVVGPKDLPRVLRTAGRMIAKAQRFKADLDTAVTNFVAEGDVGSITRELASMEIDARVSFAPNPEMGMRGRLPTGANPEIPVAETDAFVAQFSSPEMQAYLAPPPERPSLAQRDAAGAAIDDSGPAVPSPESAHANSSRPQASIPIAAHTDAASRRLA